MAETAHERVKRLRLRFGLTQEQLAHELGVSFSTINRWENGHHEPSKSALKRFDALVAKRRAA